MNIEITGAVTNKDRETILVDLTHEDIRELIQGKAKSQGIKPYEGRLWTHYDPEIIDIKIKE